MKILILLGFIAFFGLGVPAFLVWFSRFSKDLMTKEIPFIGFPEDPKDQRMNADSRHSTDGSPS